MVAHVPHMVVLVALAWLFIQHIETQAAQFTGYMGARDKALEAFRAAVLAEMKEGSQVQAQVTEAIRANTQAIDRLTQELRALQAARMAGQ